MVPETRYAKTAEGVHIAYQVVGKGPFDIVMVPGIFTHVEYRWEEPSFARFLERLASFSRLVAFDPRGAGLSDRALELPTLEQQMDDVLAVLEAVGSERAVMFGISQGGPMAALFSATYPGRTSALVLYATYAVALRDEDYPWGRTQEWIKEYLRQTDEKWGTGSFLPQVAPTRAGDDAFRAWWSRFERLASSPGNALAYIRTYSQVDVRSILPTINVPALVIQRKDDIYRDPGNSRYIASIIPAAKLVEVPGVDHLPYVGDWTDIVDEIQEFLTGIRANPEPDRLLATVMFTDIVGSSELATKLGDARWKELLEAHHARIRGQLARHRGHEVDTAGDGFFATFEGPARAIHCAAAILDAVKELGLEIRVGLHTGECELIGDKVGGIAVHIAARVAGLAGPSEILVSSTVKDLVAGSALRFEDRGVHALKGLADEWHLYAAARN